MLLDAQALKSVSLPVVLSALLLTSFGGVYTWFRVNLDEGASAARLEHALERDRESLLPLNTYTGLENLRKFYHSTRDRDRQRDILKRMAATGVQKITTYTKFSTLAVENSDAEQRHKDFTWLFEQYLREYATPAAANTVAAIDAGTLRENASKALLYGYQSGEAELAAEFMEKLRPHISPWKEEALLRTFSTPGLPPAEVASAARQAIDEQTQDAALLLAAARLHNQAGEFELAAQYYRLSMQRDDRTFPILYIELAQLLFEELDKKDEAIQILRDCRRVAPHSREAQKATDVLTQLGLFP
jgi:tetratricopeptide (TPR) repeat protein